MKYLGIDYGTKRTGVAVSDDEGRVAFPHSVLATSRTLAENIIAILKGTFPSKGEIVLGQSLDRNGVPNLVMAHIARLKETLEAGGQIVHYEDERYSSQHASRAEGEGPLHDASTAAVILQSYLDREQKGGVALDPYTPL